MARVNVFLKDELLDEINEEAKEEGTNRSALIQTALENYIEGKRREREEQDGHINGDLARPGQAGWIDEDERLHAGAGQPHPEHTAPD